MGQMCAAQIVGSIEQNVAGNHTKEFGMTSQGIRPVFTPVQSVCILIPLLVIGTAYLLLYYHHENDITHQTVEAFNEKRWEEGVRLSLTADRNDPRVQAGLGICYLLGLGGVMEDHEAGREWLEKAALNGDARGQSLLAQCYYMGKGVAKDYNLAATWWRRSAEQGWAPSQCDLGNCYFTGKGVKKDYAEAVNWFKKAAGQDHVEAQYGLGVCYMVGKGTEKDLSQGISWLRKAAAKNNANALRDLGICYQCGMGVERNLTEARKWLNKAVEQGDSKAKDQLEELEQKEDEKRRMKVEQELQKYMRDS